MSRVPVGAKKPTDRMPAAGADSAPLVVDYRGARFDISPGVLDDVEFLEKSMAFEGAESSQKPALLVEMMRHLLGDQWAAFKVAAREDNRVSFERLTEFLDAAREVVEALGNSSGSATS